MITSTISAPMPITAPLQAKDITLYMSICGMPTECCPKMSHPLGVTATIDGKETEIHASGYPIKGQTAEELVYRVAADTAYMIAKMELANADTDAILTRAKQLCEFRPNSTDQSAATSGA